MNAPQQDPTFFLVPSHFLLLVHTDAQCYKIVKRQLFLHVIAARAARERIVVRVPLPAIFAIHSETSRDSTEVTLGRYETCVLFLCDFHNNALCLCIVARSLVGYPVPILMPGAHDVDNLVVGFHTIALVLGDIAACLMKRIDRHPAPRKVARLAAGHGALVGVLFGLGVEPVGAERAHTGGLDTAMVAAGVE